MATIMSLNLEMAMFGHPNKMMIGQKTLAHLRKSPDPPTPREGIRTNQVVDENVWWRTKPLNLRWGTSNMNMEERSMPSITPCLTKPLERVKDPTLNNDVPQETTTPTLRIIDTSQGIATKR